ncbi:PE-PGRS family protein [Archangium violaceum]|nr:PE-PGRS family protein [Archangium violaceum]
MHETTKLFAVGAAVALLTAVGCYNFQEAYDDCVATGRCAPDGCKPEWADPPDDRFLDSNCDGIDGVAEHGVFVDPANGRDDVNSGTMDAPYQTISYALERISANTQAVYLARGVYQEPMLRLDRPISFHGGYAGLDGGWKRDATYITQIVGGSIGLTVSGLGEDAGVSLEWLHITSGNSTGAGDPSIGLRVLQSKGVRLRHVQIVAGAGAPGSEGSTPATAPGGADGGTGGTPPSLDGGSPGISSCGSVQNKGGTGGTGGDVKVNFGVGGQGVAGTPSAPGGDGGTFRETPVGCSGEACVCIGDPGHDGQDGLEGESGPSGHAGDGIGTLVTDTWSPTSGEAGQPGFMGGGGGGGGGGGACSSQYGAAIAQGSGGGGGGAGGCPGQGGNGGKGGGASIALLLIDAHVEMESCSLKTTRGGDGGAGGKGGTGGPGGQGGPGGPSTTTIADPSDPTTKATGGPGGRGGTGGKGGDGGPGGNGGGGPSVGVWCGPDGSVSQTGTTFSLGPAGKPGRGPAPGGHDGIQEQYHGCDPTS